MPGAKSSPPWRRTDTGWLLLAGLLLCGCRPAASVPSSHTQAKAESIFQKELPATAASTEIPAANGVWEPNSPENAAAQVQRNPNGPAETTGASAENAHRESTSTKGTKDAWRRQSRVRWIFLTDKGPILLDWLVEIDERPYPEARSELQQAAVQLVPLQGRVAWPEVIAQSVFRLYDDPSPSDGSMAASLVRQYDENNDGRVQAPELARYLEMHPQWGRVFQTPRDMSPDSRTTMNTGLWQWVDRDGDGMLEQPEWKLIGNELLQQHDRDGNGMLDAGDFVDLIGDTPMPQMMPMAISPTDVMMLDGRVHWTKLLFQMEERYGFGRELQSGVWEDRALFDQLDTNRNGRLDEAEASALAQVDPHVVVRASWSSSLPVQQSAATLGSGTTARLAIEAAPRSNRPKLDQLGPGRWLLTINNARLAIQIDDTLALVGNPESLFAQLDRDKNHYLDAAELASFFALGGVPFSWWDRDVNGQVEPAEFSGVLENLNAVMRLRLQAAVVKQEDRLFALLDANHDGRVSARELVAAERILAEADRNKDGAVAEDELPNTWQVILLRGPGAPPRPSVTEASPHQQGPAWFAAMDTNGDGDVSFNEFLGPHELFESLDRNGDGLLGVDEALHAEAAVSPGGRVNP